MRRWSHDEEAPDVPPEVIGCAVRVVFDVLAETINGLHKAELIHRQAPWKSREAVERATLERVSWFNHHRLLAPIEYGPPAGAEAACYRQLAESAATG